MLSNVNKIIFGFLLSTSSHAVDIKIAGNNIQVEQNPNNSFRVVKYPETFKSQITFSRFKNNLLSGSNVGEICKNVKSATDLIQDTNVNDQTKKKLIDSIRNNGDIGFDFFGIPFNHNQPLFKQAIIQQTGSHYINISNPMQITDISVELILKENALSHVIKDYDNLDGTVKNLVTTVFKRIGTSNLNLTQTDLACDLYQGNADIVVKIVGSYIHQDLQAILNFDEANNLLHKIKKHDSKFPSVNSSEDLRSNQILAGFYMGKESNKKIKLEHLSLAHKGLFNDGKPVGYIMNKRGILSYSESKVEYLGRSTSFVKE